jgi:hypothetical protein
MKGLPNAQQTGSDHPVLPGPYQQTASAVTPTPAVIQLVRSQVQALLESSPAYSQMPFEERRDLAHNLVKIAAYSAALVHDDFVQSQKLGQTPMLRQETILEPLARPVTATTISRAATAPAADEFSPRAASQVAHITEQTLNAIAFPKFVADLIKGTFQAIVDASIQQMEAYGGLLANVAKTVDQFMADNITDNAARDYLAASYPSHFTIATDDGGARMRVREGADERPKPDFRSSFGLTEDVDLDDDMVEEVLVPAARRRLAQNRHQMLSTMVLLGINRIVVTSGRIRATMGFRIDTSDTGRAQSASQFDFKNETTASYGGGIASWFGGPEFKTKNTVVYVSSTKKDSSDEIDVHANLTGEVDLKFKSDYFPINRLATPEMLAAIQGNTPNPAVNTPNTGTTTASGGGETT